MIADLPPDSGSRCQQRPHQLYSRDAAAACAAPQLQNPHVPPVPLQGLPQPGDP